ncbi:STAS domain-containing protein [Saccharothrix obliqua]|uniref:STAS domain-containing protein n=1 Tax=Saccharothrix obliqua TaxID=2861747 RepID=UPI002150BC77|nr:STAS domain-containing protein [Saccharothrix obliqua]
MTPLTITPGRRPDGTTLLTVVGEIDMTNAETLAAALAGTTGPLVVDLTAVEYLDSAGLHVLFTHVDRIHLLAPRVLATVLTISGLADLTTVQDGH